MASDIKEYSSGGLVQVSQTDDITPVHKIKTEWGWIRYLFSRSKDFANTQWEGQDYLCVKHSSSHFTFTLCDGVSQSFFGDLAARIVGDDLTSWLFENNIPQETKKFRRAISSRLKWLSAKSKDTITNYPLSPILPPLLKEALESLRSYGSETTFVCGRFDLPDIADKEPSKIIIAWMGNSKVELYRDGKCVDLLERWSDKDRWSSKVGLKGKLHVWSGYCAGIQRIVAYSDGLSSVSDKISTYNDLELSCAAEYLLNSPFDDDLSFLDIAINPLAENVLLRPHFITNRYRSRRKEFFVRWNQIEGALSYDIEVSLQRDFSTSALQVSTTDTCLTISTRKLTFPCYLRTRACGHSATGYWSRSIKLNIDHRSI